MSHSLWFHPLIAPLSAAHLHVVGADRRGSGMNNDRRGDAPSAKTLVADVGQIVAEEHDPRHPLTLIGWCWGAVLATHVARHLGSAVDRLIFIAPGLFPSEQVKRRAQTIVERGGALLESPVEEGMFTDGPYLERFILQDDHRLRSMTPHFFELISRMGIAAAARLARLAPPTLVLLAAGDKATDNVRTQQTFDTLPHATVCSIESGHGMQFDAPHETVRRILAWLQDG